MVGEPVEVAPENNSPYQNGSFRDRCIVSRHRVLGGFGKEHDYEQIGNSFLVVGWEATVELRKYQVDQRRA